MARYHRKSVHTPATIVISTRKAMMATMTGSTSRGQRSWARDGRPAGGRADPDRKDTALPSHAVGRYLGAERHILGTALPHSDHTGTPFLSRTSAGQACWAMRRQCTPIGRARRHRRRRDDHVTVR